MSLLMIVTNYKYRIMKARLFLSSIFCLLVFSLSAQKCEKINEIERKISDIESRPLKPDWVDFQLPERDTYFFKRIAIQADEVRGKMEADMLAQQRAFQAGADYLGYHVNVASLNASVKGNADELYIDGQAEKKISARLVCEYQETDRRGSSKIIAYWYLYEISKSGRIIAKFDSDFDCSSRKKSKERRDVMINDLKKQIAGINDTQKEAKRKVNATALAASTIIPGAGQMYKGQIGQGVGFLLSELALIGGGTTCYLLGQEQLKIMKATGTSYSDFVAAQKTKNTLDIVTYTCFGVGAAVHIANIIQAWFAEDKKHNVDVCFAPTIILMNEYSQPSYAMGAGVQIKF